MYMVWKTPNIKTRNIGTRHGEKERTCKKVIYLFGRAGAVLPAALLDLVTSQNVPSLLFPKRWQSGSIKVNRVTCLHGRVYRCGSMPHGGRLGNPAGSGGGRLGVRDSRLGTQLLYPRADFICTIFPIPVFGFDLHKCFEWPSFGFYLHIFSEL